MVTWYAYGSKYGLNGYMVRIWFKIWPEWLHGTHMARIASKIHEGSGSFYISVGMSRISHLYTTYVYYLFVNASLVDLYQF